MTGQKSQLGPDHVHLAVSMAGTGGSLLDLARVDEAEPLLLEAARIFERAQGVSRAEHRKCCEDLATLFDTRHRSDPGKGFDEVSHAWRAKADAVK